MLFLFCLFRHSSELSQACSDASNHIREAHLGATCFTPAAGLTADSTADSTPDSTPIFSCFGGEAPLRQVTSAKTTTPMVKPRSTSLVGVTSIPGQDFRSFACAKNLEQFWPFEFQAG